MENFVQPCTKIKENFSIQVKYFDNICKKSMKYLKDLERKHTSYLEITQGCIYLYYYLPADMFEEDAYNYKKLSIYKDFLYEYASTVQSDIWKYYEKNISDDILLKIKDLFDLYNNFDEFKNGSRPSKIRNKKIKHNIYQESNELQNYSKNSNVDFENTTYNIKYYNAQKC
ncbi:hypothetical protein PVMG_05352 [Plasmodium vivax Mauritania I]|uniref:Variable surface protein n=1 Tax=Plasmodium vivax Mauritania I TaxID=1035515 RepID=A0A0J9W5K8_PLAVI|nr:hypothetical protein PVMG_05352 [Plasmodium vivax Mauritania I]